MQRLEDPDLLLVQVCYHVLDFGAVQCLEQFEPAPLRTTKCLFIRLKCPDSICTFDLLITLQYRHFVITAMFIVVLLRIINEVGPIGVKKNLPRHHLVLELDAQQHCHSEDQVDRACVHDCASWQIPAFLRSRSSGNLTSSPVLLIAVSILALHSFVCSRLAPCRSPNCAAWHPGHACEKPYFFKIPFVILKSRRNPSWWRAETRRKCSPPKFRPFVSRSLKGYPFHNGTLHWCIMLSAGLQPQIQHTQLSLHILDCLLSQSIGLRVIGGRVHRDGVLLALTDISLLQLNDGRFPISFENYPRPSRRLQRSQNFVNNEVVTEPFALHQIGRTCDQTSLLFRWAIFYQLVLHPRYQLQRCPCWKKLKNWKNEKMQESETAQNVFKCAVRNGWCELFSRDPTWAQDVWVWEECHCRVYYNRLWCDQLCNNITRVQQARLLASIRDLVALRKFHKIYGCSHVSIIRVVLTSPYVLLATRLRHSFPSYQLPGELVSLSSVPIQASISTCKIVHVPALSSRCHSGSHQSDWWHRQQFPKYQMLNEWESRVNVFHLATRSEGGGKAAPNRRGWEWKKIKGQKTFQNN